MSRGPNGERRPADVVGCAVNVARIATGEIPDTKLKYPARHNSGVAGGKARAESLSKSKRSEIAKKAATLGGKFRAKNHRLQINLI